jgi:hypothetical protein
MFAEMFLLYYQMGMSDILDASMQRRLVEGKKMDSPIDMP